MLAKGSALSALRCFLCTSCGKKPTNASGWKKFKKTRICLRKMDALQKKRIVAAVTAVYRYLRSQEEQQLAMAAVGRPVSALTQGAISLWSASGRQAVMEMRRLLQLRVMH
jgi:hypothetical protein